MPVGTVVLIKQVLNLPGDSIRVLVEGSAGLPWRPWWRKSPFAGGRSPHPGGNPQGNPRAQGLVRTTHEYF